MKIAIDVSQIIYDTGVSVYTRGLVENLVGEFPENKYILFGGTFRRREEIKRFTNQFSNAQSVVTPLSPSLVHILWNRLHIMPIEKFVGKVDLFHSSDWAEPPSKYPKVTTIHDLAPILFPELTNPKIVATHKARLYWVKKESDLVIVPSKASFEDAINLGISKDRLKVVPEALRTDMKKASEDEVLRVKTKYRISGKYAISIGNNARKNTARIVNAFEKAKAESGIDKLVVVGRGENTQRGVIYTGHVPNADLPALYTGAEVLLYPSIYEGFGLPILEAFSCDLPVVTSNISSMAEVAEKAAALVDPYEVESISEGITKAVKEKEKLVKLGKERLKHFSWKKTAIETMEVYKTLI